MIDDLKPYPEYKRTEIEWLGDIPAHWHIHRIASLALSLQTGPFGSQLHSHEYVDGGVPVINPSHMVGGRIAPDPSCSVSSEKARQLARHICAEGDVLFARRGELGRCALVTATEAGCLCGTGSLKMCVLRESVSGAYLVQLLQLAGPHEWLSLRSIGSTMENLNTRLLASLPLPIPPLPEQAAITRFLDWATGRLERAIRAKRKVIALLSEQKQAIIHQTVTRGLDPTVPLKPSGVGWLGKIPAHWEVRRVKSLSVVKRGASPRPIANPDYFAEDGDYAWVRIADVTASEHYLERTAERLSALGQRYSVTLEPGAIFLSIAGSIGKPIITRIKCCIHDGFVYFPRLPANPEFLFYVFASGKAYAGLGKLGTQLNLNTETVGSIRLGWPPPEEQSQIVQYLDHALVSLSKAQRKLLEGIALIREYRTRLVADVVTGKLDVREAAARLPDDAAPEIAEDDSDLSDEIEAADEAIA